MRKISHWDFVLLLAVGKISHQAFCISGDKKYYINSTRMNAG